MSMTIIRKGSRIIRALPDLYTLQPQTNYQNLISHSSRELMQKAHAKTTKQMQHALNYAEQRLVDAKD